MEYLFNDWAYIDRKIRGQKNVMLLCDYDGTLTPIVDRPELAAMSEEMHKALSRLVSKKQFILGVISGRALGDIKERVNIDGLIYAGNHGFEIEGPGLKFIHPLADELTSVLRLISQVLRKAFNNMRGVIVEDKGMTVSVHYRLVADAELPELHSKFESIVTGARAMGKIKTTTGKKVHEIRPAIAWDKGKAVNLIIEKYIPQHKRNKLLTVYLGDDRTDEDAFRVINQYGGISILVDKEGQASQAKYYLNSPDEVGSLLAELYKMV